ncbi:preprotein translocase subunit SecA [Piscinibacterium candidicorallinum]|uniref:Protein translocase subunit SecA n=1 Tax=Piscinibacterium candidicorallinum TaxID=1793872 RepID=A0ABV7H4Y2_9BURK
MLQKFLTSIFGSRNERLLKQYRGVVAKINALEPAMKALTDEQLQAKTAEFKERLAQGATLDSLLVEAFAVVREASVRVMGMRHFDVQLIGGIALHQGKIAEMRTGEGKTLTATTAVYLNALQGKGVHVVTVNDYLVQRDAEWNGRLYKWLGLTVGFNVANMEREAKQQAYAADVTYGTNNEFGFDYLRDNLVQDVADRVQRPLSYAIVDEVDSILIDEARTPLIISGQAEDHTETYMRVNQVPPLLNRMKTEPKPTEPEPEGDYWVDEKGQQIHIGERGYEKAEQILTRMGLLPEGASLYDPQHITLLHHVTVAIRAHALFHKDQHYVVQNNEVVIVDEFTGRLMSGRRWSDGLHQAVEAKEGVPIQAENQTLASITFQNYFRMYGKLAGMTGTADTEAYEFQQIYTLETVVIPTHRPMIRKDLNDQVFRTSKEKYDAILKDIVECHGRGQPVLVGTTSVENSELISGLLTKAKLPHQVLNAKQHAREAEIVAQAGKPGAIMVATNMAGRGTDIVLGGNVEKQIQFINADAAIPEAEKATRAQKLKDEWQSLHDQVIASGGLKIIGTERHESRRIDNQLRGRSGRQGDPGVSRFYMSMDDSLLRIFAGERLKSIMDRLRLPEGEPIEAGMVTRSIESAQRKVEARNFDIRKQLLEYDDVANDQRKEIYALRNTILESKDVGDMVRDLRHGVMTELFRSHVPEESVEEQWDLDKLQQELASEYQLNLPLRDWADKEEADDAELLSRIIKAADEAYDAKVEQVGREPFANFERSLLLQSIDLHWREHISALDHLRQGIHLRGYAQKNPKQEYKREAFEMFGTLLTIIKNEVTRVVMNVRVQSAEQLEQAEEALEESTAVSKMQYQHAAYDDLAEVAAGDPGTDEPPVEVRQQPIVRFGDKVGRNDPCPCGSGKKYKNCHGKLA